MKELLPGERTDAGRVSKKAKGFRKDESGAMIIFGLIIFVMMLLAGGMAVDFIRFEHERANLQYTLDRAVLASAALSQPLDPVTVAEDYFDKSDLENYELDVRMPTNVINAREITANASLTMNTFFINMLGIESMDAAARGAAEERIPKVEISLVLDVSGSMGNNGKLANLKTAAKEFVDTLLIDENEDLVSISLIPYNMQVNAGEDLLNAMNVSDEHDSSHCVDFSSSSYNSAAISSSSELQRAGHFDPFYTSIDHPGSASDDNHTRLFMCPTTSYSEIITFSQDAGALRTRIDALEAGGNTSIDIGAKWGTYLLDPSSNAALVGAGGMDTAFDTRPASYSDEETIKILVIMTDGVNTTEYRLNDDFRDGPSTIWRHEDNRMLSFQTDAGTGADSNGDGFRDNADFFISDSYTWNSGDTYWDNVPWFNSPDGAPDFGDQLSWPAVWDMMGARYYAYYLNYEQEWNASDYWDARNDVMSSVSGSTKNTRLTNICSQAKSNNIVVFSIGFEISNSAANVMKTCATSESNFFKVEDTEISDAFNAIAQTIQRLKLTH